MISTDVTLSPVTAARAGLDSYILNLDKLLNDGEDNFACVDARRYANVARFINHSCAPNLLKQNVYCGENIQLQTVSWRCCSQTYPPSRPPPSDPRRRKRAPLMA